MRKSKVIKCPICGNELLDLGLGEQRCRKCDKYFINGKEIIYTEDGVIYYANTKPPKMYKNNKTETTAWYKVKIKLLRKLREKHFDKSIRGEEHNDTIKVIMFNYPKFKEEVYQNSTVAELSTQFEININQMYDYMRGKTVPMPETRELMARWLRGLGKDPNEYFNTKEYTIEEAKDLTK